VLRSVHVNSDPPVGAEILPTILTDDYSTNGHNVVWQQMTIPRPMVPPHYEVDGKTALVENGERGLEFFFTVS
jgi:hypothetical protein